MSLRPGTRFGPYSATSQIGEGGMGEAWQATNTRLNRAIALKILPDAFATDPDRLARFQREAKVLASLNHRRSPVPVDDRDQLVSRPYTSSGPRHRTDEPGRRGASSVNPHAVAQLPRIGPQYPPGDPSNCKTRTERA